MAYDAEMAVLVVLSKRLCTLDFSKNNVWQCSITRDLWHDSWPRDRISMVTKVASLLSPGHSQVADGVVYFAFLIEHFLDSLVN